MSYILVKIPADGMIRSENPHNGATYGCSSTVIHKTTVDLDKVEGIRVFDKLETVKSYWEGPKSDEAILNLDERGAAKDIWMAEAQTERLTSRLKIWASCYGGFKIRKLSI